MYAPSYSRPAGVLVILLIIGIVLFTIANSNGAFGSVEPVGQIPQTSGTPQFIPTPLPPTPDIQQTQAAQLVSQQAATQAAFVFQVTATAVVGQQIAEQAAYQAQSTAQAQQAQAAQSEIDRKNWEIQATAVAVSNAEVLQKEAKENQLLIEKLAQQAFIILVICIGLMVTLSVTALALRSIWLDHKQVSARVIQAQTQNQLPQAEQDRARTSGPHSSRKMKPSAPLPSPRPPVRPRNGNGKGNGRASEAVLGKAYESKIKPEEDLNDIPWCE